MGTHTDPLDNAARLARSRGSEDQAAALAVIHSETVRALRRIATALEGNTVTAEVAAEDDEPASFVTPGSWQAALVFLDRAHSIVSRLAAGTPEAGDLTFSDCVAVTAMIDSSRGYLARRAVRTPMGEEPGGQG